MRDVELNFAWAQRLTERRAQRHSSERIVRWIAPPVAQKERLTAQRAGSVALDGSSNDNRVSGAARATG